MVVHLYQFSTASLSYVTNDIDNISFNSVFKNSINYKDSTSDLVHLNISKQTPTSIYITVPTVNHYLNITNITATVTFPLNDVNSKQGLVQFTVVNNGESNETTVDLNNGVAELKLLLENTSQYSVSARFNGNDTYTS